jgi:hypothetical protein
MILELRQPHRRIDRHRNGSGVKNAEERDKKITAGWEHQGNAIPGRNVARNQATPDVARSACKFTVSQCGENRRLVLKYGQVQTVWMPRCMPLKNPDKGLGFARSRHRREVRRRRRFKSYALPPRSGLVHRPYQIVDGFGLADGLSRQSHAECTFDPQDQLSSTQTVDPKIALDPAGRKDVDESDALGMQFAHKLCHHRD